MSSESRFSTGKLPVNQRFDVWRESISVLYDVGLDSGVADDGFSAELHGHLYDNLMIARTRTSAQVYRRDSARIARDDVDHYMIQFFMDGQQRIRRGSRTVESRPGEIMIHDLAAEHVAESSAFDNLSLVIPRRALESRLTRPDSQHGRLLSSALPMVKMLSRHMRDLYELAPYFDAAERRRLSDVTAGLVAAALNGVSSENGTDMEQTPAVAVSALLRAKRSIEGQLGTPDIVIGEVARDVGVSRASLYRLFEPYGGVMAYIRRRRLSCCLRALIRQANAHRSISDIAYDHGFANEAHFSRLFKQTFGMTPSEARHAGTRMAGSPGLADPAIGDRRYEHWIAETLQP